MHTNHVTAVHETELVDIDAVAKMRAQQDLINLAARHPHICAPTESGEYPVLTDDQIFELDRALRGVA